MERYNGQSDKGRGYKRISAHAASRLLGISRNALTYQVRSGKGPLAKLGFFIDPMPGIEKGQYVFYEETILDFMKNQGWAK